MVKYGPLLVGLLILFGFIPKVVSDNLEKWPEILIDMAFPIIISILLFVLFFKIKDKLKYVAIGKSKIIIKKDGQEVEYNWLDVEEITLIRFLGLYKLKIKAEDEIYFTPYGMTTWLTGDDSDMGVIINKNKRDFKI